MSRVKSSPTQLTLSLCLALGSSFVAAAQPSIPEAWLTARALAPDAPKAPLVVRFSADEARCNKAYPKRNEQQDPCLRKLGALSQPIQGIRLVPARDGYWRWQSSNEAAFYPNSPWNPNEAFTLDLSGLNLPRATTLSTPSIKARTRALSANVEIALLQDPNPQAIGSITADLNFLTAVPDRAAIERAVSLTPEHADVTLGAPVFLWRQEAGRNVGVRIQWTILSVGDADTSATLTVKSLAPAPNAQHLKVQGALSATVNIRGTHQLYRIERVRAEQITDADMRLLTALRVRSSLAVDPAALARAIEVYELPEKLDQRAVQAADWTKAPVVDESVLKASRKLDVQLSNTLNTASNEIALTVKATPGRYLLVHVPQGFGPAKNRVLSEPYAAVVGVAREKARLEFMEPGNMLTLSGRRTLTLHAAGIKKLQWRLSRVRDPYLALTAQRNEAFAVETDLEVGSSATGEITSAGAETTDGRFIALKLNDMLPGGLTPGLYDLELTAEKSVDTEYVKELQRAKRILVSDIGLIAKKSDTAPSVFALNVATGQPVEGLTIDLVGANGLPIETARTNSAGLARFSSIAGLVRERKPVALIARRGAPLHNAGDILTEKPLAANTTTPSAQPNAASTASTTSEAHDVLAWLPIANWSTEDQFYQYDVYGKELKAGAMNGLVFTERSLYRPGETLHAGALVKNLGWKGDVGGVPLKISVIRNTETPLYSAVVKTTPEGLAEAAWKIPDTIEPGLLSVVLEAGGTELERTQIRIQAFEPESTILELKPQTAPSAGWMSPEEAALDATLTFGFGAAAPERALRGELTLTTPTEATFPAWPGYVFQARPQLDRESAYAGGRSLNTDTDHITLSGFSTDEQGKARITLPALESAAGLRMANVELEGTDSTGARVASASASFFVSSDSTLLGSKLIDTATPLSALNAGDKATLSLALVDRTLKGQADVPLTLEVARRRYVTELTADDRGYLTYRDTPALETSSSTTETTAADGTLRFTLPTERPGEWTLRVKDPTGRVLSEIAYFVQGTEVKPENGVPTAFMKLALEKGSAAPGETITVNILSPFDGTALLTLESDGVTAAEWKTVRAGQNALTFTIPKEADGKYWLTTSLVRGPAWANRYLKAYSSATAPIVINRAAHELNLTLSTEPEQADATHISITLAGSESGAAFLWAVDDAILRPTDYHLPDPLKTITESQALATTTYETLEALMPEGLQFPGSSPEGGDGMAKSRLAAVLANPFRRQLGEAAVKWLGIVPVSTTPETHVFALPEAFEGQVRIMAIAANATHLGAAQAETRVRPLLTLTPSMPRFAAPGDKFSLTYALTAKEPLESHVNIHSTGPISVSPSSEQIALSAEGSVSKRAEVLVAELPGAAAVHFNAEAPNARTLERVATLSVRPATLKQQSATWGVMTQAQGAQHATASLTAPFELIPYEAEDTVRLAPSPLPVLATLISAMRAAPSATITGAIAQSAPWVALAGKPEVIAALGLSAEEISRQLKSTVPTADAAIAFAVDWNRLQTDRGTPDMFTAALALDWLLTVRDRGIPSNSESTARRLIKALSADLYNTDITDPIAAGGAAAALYQMTRAGMITAEPLEWLRRRLEQSSLGWDWRHDATALWMAATYRLMHMQAEADAIAPTQIALSPNAPQDKALALLIGALAKSKTDKAVSTTLSLLKGDAPPEPLVALSAMQVLLRELSQTAQGNMGEADVRCQRFAPGFTATSPVRSVTSLGASWQAPGCLAWQIQAASPAPLYWSLTHAGYPRKLPAAGLSQGLSLQKHLSSAKSEGKAVTHVALGETVTITLTLSAYQKVTGNLIVTDLLPAGFELMRQSDESENFYTVERIDDEDRVVFVVGEHDGDTILTYTLRAAYPGQFTLPAADARSTQTPSLRALSPSGTISVK